MNKFIILCLLFLSFSCIQPPEKNRTPTKKYGWENIQEKGEVQFLTINSSSAYRKDKEGEPEGFEYELAKAFAEDHNLKFKIKSLDSIEQILDQLSLGNGNIGAAGITETFDRKYTFEFGPSYFEVFQTVVCKKHKKIKSENQLYKLKLVVPAHSSYAETLKLLRTKDKNLTWEEREDSNSETLLHEIWKDGKLCTIVDSHLLNLHQRYLPELKRVYKFKKKNQLAWSFNQNQPELNEKIKLWFSKKETQLKITELKRKYFEFIKFDPFNIKVFNKRIKKRLPKYLKYFKSAAKKYNLEWQFIAAVSYQESFWNPKAVSPTGVKGMMMLTKKTAKDLKVKNRVNPKESIMGGAKYLKHLISRIPEYVYEEDKIWFALASYNVGYYHLRDAMALSIWQNEDPTRWHSIAKVLPLLSRKKYYRRLPYGHARGFEPVIYVKRIKDFYDILKKRF